MCLASPLNLPSCSARSLAQSKRSWETETDRSERMNMNLLNNGNTSLWCTLEVRLDRVQGNEERDVHSSCIWSLTQQSTDLSSNFLSACRSGCLVQGTSRLPVCGSKCRTSKVIRSLTFSFLPRCLTVSLTPSQGRGWPSLSSGSGAALGTSPSASLRALWVPEGRHPKGSSPFILTPHKNICLNVLPFLSFGDYIYFSGYYIWTRSWICLPTFNLLVCQMWVILMIRFSA